MRINVRLILSFIFVCILGVLLHFTYDWSSQNPIIGFFSAKNESTWEHLKLIFFPFLFLTIYDGLLHRDFATEHLPGRTLGVLMGMTFIVVAFYCFWGISGRLLDFVNIAIYFGGVIFAFWVEKRRPGKHLPWTPPPVWQSGLPSQHYSFCSLYMHQILACFMIYPNIQNLCPLYQILFGSIGKDVRHPTTGNLLQVQILHHPAIPIEGFTGIPCTNRFVFPSIRNFRLQAVNSGM